MSRQRAFLPLWVALVCGAFLGAQISTRAQVTSTWTGGASTINWNDATNWTNGVPGATLGQHDAAIFNNTGVSLNSTYNIATPISLGSFTLGGSKNTTQTFGFSGTTINFDNGASPATLLLSGYNKVTIANAFNTAGDLAIATTDNTAIDDANTMSLVLNNAITLAANKSLTFNLDGVISNVYVGGTINGSGTGAVTKNGIGTLTFNPGATGTYASYNATGGATVVLGNAALGSGAGNHPLGTGNVTIDNTGHVGSSSDPTTTLTFKSTAAGQSVTLNSGASLTTIAGAKVNFLQTNATDGYTFNLAGGNLNLGTGGTLALTGVNLALNSGTLAGVNLLMDTGASATQNLTGSVALTGSLATMAKTGTGVLNVNLTGAAVPLNIGALTLSQGLLKFNAASSGINTSQLTLDGGNIEINNAGQLAVTNAFNVTNKAPVYMALNTPATTITGAFNYIGSGTGDFELRLGGNGSTPYAATFNAINNNNGLFRINGWHGNTTSSYDNINASSVANLSNVWFYGYQRGAQLTGGVLAPTAYLSSTWSGLGSDNQWFTANNWGGDAYNIPNSPGAIATIGSGAPALPALNTGGRTVTLGQFYDNGVANDWRISGTFIMDSGSAGVAAIWGGKGQAYMPNKVILNSDLIIQTANTQYAMSTLLSGSGKLIIKSSAFGTNPTGSDYTGGTSLDGGTVYMGGGNSASYVDGSWLGSGTITINGAGGALYGQYTNQPSFYTVRVTNPLAFGSGSLLSVGAVWFDWNGNLDLSGTKSINVVSPSASLGYSNQSVIFGTGFNFTGTGALRMTGAYTKSLKSGNNTFSGGLTVDQGQLYAPGISTGVTIGMLDPGHNYLGSGNITLLNSGAWINVQGNTAIKGGQVSVSNNGTFYVSNGILALSSGTVSTTTGGVLRADGDVLFDGSTLSTLSLSLFGPSATLRASAGNGSVTGITYLVKGEPNTKTLDTSITSMNVANTVSVLGGILRMSSDNQITSPTLLLNGGGFDTNGFHTTFTNLNLGTADSSLLVGNAGGLTFSTRSTGGSWSPTSHLVIQNTGANWIADPSGSYVRFINNPFNLVTDASLLANIGFTGYENGATVSALTGGYYYLLPNSVQTNEWSGGNNATNNNWGAANNWLSGTTPNAANASATFRDLDANLNGKIINIDNTYTLGRLNISSNAASSFTIAGTGTLVFNGTNSAINQATADITYSAPMRFDTPTDLNIQPALGNGSATLAGSISGTGSLSKKGNGNLFLADDATGLTGNFYWQDSSHIATTASGKLFGSGTLVIGTTPADTVTETLSANLADRSYDLPGGYILAGNLTFDGEWNGVSINSNSYSQTLNGDGYLTSGTHKLQLNWNGIGTPGTITLNGVISGPGGLSVSTQGSTLNLMKTNTFTGDFIWNVGNVYGSANNAFGAGTIRLYNTSYLYSFSTAGAGGLTFTNRLEFGNATSGTASSSQAFNGTFHFDADSSVVGNSVINGGYILVYGGGTLWFGKNHVIQGTGGFSSPLSTPVIVMQGANNIYTGGHGIGVGTLVIGASSTLDASGNVTKGPIGTGVLSMGGSGYLEVFSDDSAVTTQTLGNKVSFGNINQFTLWGGATNYATRLILNTPTIAITTPRAGTQLTVRTGTLTIASQITDSGVGGFIKNGASTLELTNGNNIISSGVSVTEGPLLINGGTGSVTIGTAQAGENQLGISGSHTITGAGSQIIVTAPSGTIALATASMEISSGALLSTTSPNTYLLGSGSYFSTAGNGTLRTSANLIKADATTTQIGVLLDTPNLLLQGGSIQMNLANLMANTHLLTFDGGTLNLNGNSQTFASDSKLYSTLNGGSLDFGTPRAGIITLNNIGTLGGTLVINNWAGNYRNGGGNSQIIFNQSYAAISPLFTEDMLAEITYTGYAPGAKLYDRGNGTTELLPAGVSSNWLGLVNTSGAYNWSSGGNWIDGDGFNSVPSGAGSSARFGNEDTTLGLGHDVTLNASYSLGSIVFDRTIPGNINILSPTNMLTFAAATPTGKAILQSTPADTANATLNVNAINLKNDLLVQTLGTGTITLNSPILGVTGSENVTKNGPGTLVLDTRTQNSIYNTYTIQGGTTVIFANSTTNAAGVITSGPLGTGTTQVTASGAIITGTNITLANKINIDPAAASLTIDTLANSSTLTGIITGDGSLIKDGSGNLNLTGNNTFTGGITLNSGTLGIGSSAALGTGTLAFDGNATLAITGSSANAMNDIAIAPGVNATLDASAASGTLGGVISGNSLSKIGTGTIALTGSNTLAGTLYAEGGVLNFANQNAAGSAIVQNDAGIELGFNTGTFANTIQGAGLASVSGSGVTLHGDNTAFTGTWNITPAGYANITDHSDLGASSQVVTNGHLAVTSGSNFQWTNALSGTGALDMNLTNGGTFTFAASTGNAFIGVANNNSTFNWDAPGSAALANATLSLNNSSYTTVTGSQSAKTLSLNGGSIRMTTPTSVAYVNTLNVDPANGGYVQGFPVLTSLLTQDELNNNPVIIAQTITGDWTQLKVSDATGAALPANTIQSIYNTGDTTNAVANGHYANGLNLSTVAGGTAVNLSIQLTQIDILAGKTLILDGDTAAPAGANNLTVPITGNGNLQINATNAITLSSPANTYTGSTLINTGILKAGNSNIIASSTAVTNNSTFDLNRYDQTLHNLSGTGVVQNNFLNPSLLTLDNSANTTYNGSLNGLLIVIKEGNATLTLSGSSNYTRSGSSNYAEGTQINSGTLKVTNANATGNSAINVSSLGTLDLALNGTYNNAITGSGTTVVSGSTVTLGGINTIAQWQVTGNGAVTTQENLGDGAVNLANTGNLNLNASNWNWTNALAGSGTLSANLNGGTLTMAATTGNAFTGVVNMNNGYYQLDNNGANALATATLSLNTSGSTEITASSTIGTLAMNGGVLKVQTTGVDNNISGTLTVTNLTVTTGTLQMNKPASVVDDTNVTTAASFFDQSGTIQQMIVNATGSVNGVGTQLNLIDYSGSAIGTPLLQTVKDASTATTGTATYTYYASVTGTGIGLAYGLTELSANTGAYITLSNSNATGQTLGTKLTGTGGFIMSGTGVYGIGNAGNNYLGATQVTTGTVQALTNNALGQTSLLDIASNAGVNLNGKTQTIGALNTAAGSTLDIAGGILTISDTQRAAGDTNGGHIANNTLFGNGHLIIDPSLLTVDGTQAFSGTKTLVGSSTLIMNNAAAYNNGATIELVTANDRAIYGDLAAQTGSSALPAGVTSGTSLTTYNGAGVVQLSNTITLALGGTSAGFSGTWAIDPQSTLIASTTANLGTAGIADNGTLIMANAADETLANALSGSGALTKQAAGNLTLTQANNAFTGTTLINGGTLTLANLLGTGTGNVTNNAALVLAATGAYANNVAGTGTNIIANNAAVSLTGTNNPAAWNIAANASGTVGTTANLGTGATNIDGLLNVAQTLPSAQDWTYTNALTGSGTLAIDLGNSANVFAFASTAGTAYQGTVTLASSTFALAAQNTAALTHATLEISNNNITTVGTGTQQIGNLTLTSGTIGFTLASNGTAADGIVKTNTLDVRDTTVRVDTTQLNTSVPLLQQDEGINIQLVSSTTLAAGSKTQITGAQLIDQNGAALSNATQRDIVQNAITTASGTYDYAATANNTGLYLGYTLTALDLLAGQTTTLDNDIDNAVLNGADELHATITGAGNLAINATAHIILNNGANTYTGTTFVNSGTLIAGADNALGQTTALVTTATATFDLAGHAQTIGALANDGTVNVNSGTLSILNGGTSNGTLAGEGQLTLTAGTLTINGVNNNLAANVAIATSATARLTDAAGLGTTGTVTLAQNATLDLATTTDGAFFKTLAGAGTLIKSGSAGTTLTLTAPNAAFTGTAHVQIGTLAATDYAALGTAPIVTDANATFELVSIASTGTFANTVSGSGTFAIANSSAPVSISGSNSMANATITNATVVMLNPNALGTATTAVTLGNANSSVWIATDNAGLGTVTLNGGTLGFMQTGTTFRKATIAALTGAPGMLYMNLNFDGATGLVAAGTKADFFKIGNDGTAAQEVHINATGTPGADSTAFDLIDAGTATASYHLDTSNGRIDVGASSFELLKGADAGGTLPLQGNHWYLVDTGLSNAADVIADIQSTISIDWNVAMDALYLRMGDLRAENFQNPSNDAAENKGKASGNFWIRSRGYRLNATSSVTGDDFTQYAWGITAGMDKAFVSQNATNLLGGFIDAGTVDGDMDVRGSTDTRSVGVGVYLTHLRTNGYFADIVVRADHYSNSIDAKTPQQQTITGDYNTHSIGASVEVGRRLQRRDGWWIEPTLQMSTLWLTGADYVTKPANMPINVSVESTRSTQYRALVRFGKQIGNSRWAPYGKFGAVAVDSDGGTLQVNEKTVAPTFDGKRVEFGAGTTYKINDRSQCYLDYEYAKASNYERPWTLNLGYRKVW